MTSLCVACRCLHSDNRRKWPVEPCFDGRPNEAGRSTWRLLRARRLAFMRVQLWSGSPSWSRLAGAADRSPRPPAPRRPSSRPAHRRLQHRRSRPRSPRPDPAAPSATRPVRWTRRSRRMPRLLTTGRSQAAGAVRGERALRAVRHRGVRALGDQGRVGDPRRLATRNSSTPSRPPISTSPRSRQRP